MAEQYHVVFEGKLVEGQDAESVKNRLGAMLKIDQRQAEKIFSGNRVVIRKNVDMPTARKIKNALNNAGAECQIEPATGTGDTVAIGREDIGAVQAVQPTPQTKEPPKALDTDELIVTNIETVPGRTIVEHFGLVSGSTIRAKHVGRDIMASLKNLIGGELKGYTQLLQESRSQAMERMMEQARQLGANAIVNVRFSTSSVAQGAAELYAYGTAVRVQ
jgi:uncharacterized protein YbjQ (UPF0145 family)